MGGILAGRRVGGEARALSWPAPENSIDSAQPTNYWDYIRVEELLKLQGGLEGDEAKLTNDEVLFITVHQVFELWFKLMVRELRSMRDIFKAEHVSEQAMSGLVHGVRRVVVILQR